jgi:hypothetical protein
MGSYYALKGYSVSRQRRIILVESTQIRWFLRRSGGGGWPGRAIAQWRPGVSKLGLKGLSDCHSNETAVKSARWGASGPDKRATLIKYLLKGESWTTALSLTKQRAKGSPPEKNTTIMKELLTLTLGKVADGRS